MSVIVQLTADAAMHSAYAELAATPPSDVEYRLGAATGPARGSDRLRLLRVLLGAASLPHVRPFSPSAGVDLVHAQQALLLTRAPWVVDIEHACPFVGTSFRRLTHRHTRALIRRILRQDACRAILPWTETAAHGFAEMIDDERVAAKVEVVSPAVGIAGTAPREHHGVATRVLMVANAPWWNVVIKGGRELAEAVHRLRARWPRLTLDVVGPDDPEVRAAFGDVDGVRWHGRTSRDGLRQLYAAADVFALPTLSDTFGMVFLEAMAHGLPLVALDRPYTRDIVFHGENGWLVPPDPQMPQFGGADGIPRQSSPDFIASVLQRPRSELVVEGLVRALGSLVADPDLRQQLGQHGRALVAHGRFSVATRNARLERIYRRAVDVGSGQKGAV
jgi:glycosyltransferase involved in cell wall biosynthesis